MSAALRTLTPHARRLGRPLRALARMARRLSRMLTRRERAAEVTTADRAVVVDAGPAPRSARTPVPRDPALRHMAEVLDPDVMAEVLARSLGEDAAPPDVRVHSLCYEPDTELVVRYDVGVGGRRHLATATIARGDLAERARKSENLALADMVNGRSPAEHPLFFEPALGALVQWLPLDLSLWALAVPPAQRDQRLRSAGVRPNSRAEESLLLAYRPRRRAVVRLDRHVLKYYASHASFGAAVAGLEAADAAQVQAPEFEASIPELLLTVQSHVSGPTFASPAAAAAEAGAVLARLHAGSPAGVRDFPPGEQMEAAAASAQLAGRIAPGLRPRLETLLGRLEARAPSGLRHVPAHGSFNARRLVDGADGLVLTDFDAMCAAPAGLDVATYLADMVRGDPADLDTALATQETLLQGYEERPEELSWYLATTILRRSPHPFRYQDERWPERVEQMVAAAERAYP